MPLLLAEGCEARLVFKAHRLWYHSSLGSGVIKKMRLKEQEVMGLR
jgi:hypothetical protein